ncbi:MAG: YicC family protein [Vicingaceae bacterium]
MILSMTGYGKAVGEFQNKKITVEIKALNSKNADLNTRIPGLYKEKELEIRALVTQLLYRGKIDISITYDNENDASDYVLNKALFKKYYADFIGLKEELQENTDLFQIISRLPDVFKNEKKELDNAEWQKIEQLIKEACEHLTQYRKTEGVVIEKEYLQRVELILTYLKEVEKFEKERIQTIKQRIENNLKDLLNDNILKERLEQELIFYIEKLDISEEKSRLAHHCDYFKKVLQKESNQGKKLGFIIQEMGREINTLGSKANHADIQKLVVKMKDELEKMKEQILNVL